MVRIGRVGLFGCLVAVATTIVLSAVPAARAGGYKRSVENYAMPDVVLVNQDGRKVRFRELVAPGKPVLLDFVYGTCTTICPVLSAGMSSFQGKLGADVRKVQLVSITIDPENDTPRVLKEYLARYRARPGWDFLTGSRRDIDLVMRAFNAYVSDKMYHQQLVFIQSANRGGWIRIDGLMGSTEYLDEYRKAGWK